MCHTGALNRNDGEKVHFMSKSLIDLISILDLEQLEVNLFRGNSPKTSWQRVFGGQVIGQAMVAACRTVEGRLPHSLHCYFVLPGDPQIPIIYQVERLRDGKSYSTRRVTAIQHGNAIFSIMVSFHAEEESAFDHQDRMPDVPPPEKLTAEEVAKQPMFREMPDFIRRYYESDRPIELRPVELGRYFGQKIDDGRIHVWIKTAAKLPDDPALHMCALAYASDFSLLDAIMARYGRTLFDKRMMPASLDHAMWFHRPFRADEWLLYAQDSPSARGGRGLTRGSIFKPDGTLVASVAQEGSRARAQVLGCRPRALDELELRHGPGEVPAQQPRNRNDQDAAETECQGSPKQLQARADEYHLTPRSHDVSANPAHPCGHDPGPADDREHGEKHQQLPADKDPGAAVERHRNRLTVRADIGDHPSHDHPGQERLERDRRQLKQVVDKARIARQRECDEDVPDIADLAGETDVRPLRNVNAREEPAIVAGGDPGSRNHGEVADHQQDAPSQERP